MRNLTRFINSYNELTGSLSLTAKPRVAVIGSFNSGKSTLINHLLGEEISPAGILPTTPCLINLDYGNSFKATFNFSKEKKIFYHRIHLHTFLAQLKFSSGEVNIELPSPLLKKCRIVDSPGIDSINGDSGRIAEKAAAGADKIIYMFHQRGIEDRNRLFLYKLASAWKNKNLNDISFWLNCSLGGYDGTSLETTRAALRNIFLNPVRLNTINVLKQENVDTLKLFLEVELVRDALRRVSDNLKKIDADLLQKIKKTAFIKDDSLFLSEFWDTWKTAALILQAGRLMHSLPSVIKDLESHLSHMNSTNLRTSSNEPSGRTPRAKTAGIREAKGALLDLLNFLLNDNHTEKFTDRAKLKELYNSISEKRFAVVAAGGFSTGKSTFFNALLKEKLLPTADGPTTTSITRLTYGNRKTAVVKFPIQVTLHIYEQISGKIGLCRDELAVLEKWLSSPACGIAHLESCVDGHFRHVDKREMLETINQVKELFAAGTFAGSWKKSTPPAAFKLVSAKKLKNKRLLQKVRVTFKNPENREFDLSTPEGIWEFQSAVGPDNAFRVETVDIQHPSEFLKLSDFIDTPGLDWIQKHHYEKTARHIRQSDACLFFLNARHILNEMDSVNFQELTWSKMAGDFKWEGFSGKVGERFVFLINFVDTLTPSQREAVYNFVRKNLTSITNPGCNVFSNPKILLISALKGLAGQGGGMDTFIKYLEDGILKYRGRDFYLSEIKKLYFILDCASRKVYDELMSGDSSYEIKLKLRKAQDILRRSKRTLKDIKATVYNPGGL